MSTADKRRCHWSFVFSPAQISRRYWFKKVKFGFGLSLRKRVEGGEPTPLEPRQNNSEVLLVGLVEVAVTTQFAGTETGRNTVNQEGLGPFFANSNVFILRRGQPVKGGAIGRWYSHHKKTIPQDRRADNRCPLHRWGQIIGLLQPKTPAVIGPGK